MLENVILSVGHVDVVYISKTGGAKAELPPEGGGESGYKSARCDKSTHLFASTYCSAAPHIYVM